MRNTVFYLALVTVFTTGTKSLNRTELIKKCRYKGNMCDIDTSCFTDLHKKQLITDCDEFPSDTPKKNKDIDQALSFRPKQYVLDEDLPPNATYSVVLSADSSMENLTWLPGCCNLDPNDNNDTCRMNATFDQKKKFNVVFPFKKDSNPYEPLYCRLRIAYDNVIYKFCKGDEVIDPCLIYTDDGEVRIKYRYTSLTTKESENLYTTRCYFSVARENVPQDKANTQGSFKVTDPSFVTMVYPSTAIVRNDNVTCIIREGVKGNHSAVAAEIYQDIGGDFICCGTKSLSSGSNQNIYYQDVLCTSTQAWRIEIPTLPIVASVAAFLALLLLIASVKSWRLYHKLKHHKEHLPKLADQINGDENKRKKSHLNRLNNPATVMEKVDKMEFNDDDDTTSISSKTGSFPKVSEKQGIIITCDNAEQQSNHYERNETNTYISKNRDAMDKTSSGSTDSGYSGGMSSDFDGYCKKSYSTTELSESTTSVNNTTAGSGYMAKPSAIDATLPHKHQESPMFAENTQRIPDGVTLQNFESGYIPK